MMPTEKKRHLFSVQIVFLLVLVMSQISLPVIFAETYQLDEAIANNLHIDYDYTIIWETNALPEYLDPHKNHESVGSHVAINVYETLYTYPWDSADTTHLEPLLAEHVVISSDGLIYTFTLRQGITFHDGTSFNATAVQMNFWRMLGRGWDYGWGPVWMIAEPILGGQAVEDAVFEYGDGSPEHIAAWANWQENVTAIEVLSDYEVAIHLAYPFAPFLQVLACTVGSIISPTYFVTHGGMSPESDDVYLDDHMCGTGPFYLDEWIDYDRLRIVLYRYYWREMDAKMTHPYAGTTPEVTWKKNTDANSRMLNLQEGITDGCEWSVLNAYDIWNNVTTRDDGSLQSVNPEIKVWTGLPNYNIMFLGFNMHPYWNFSGNLVQNPFQDWELRAAISYAFDYETIIDKLLNGIATPLRGPIPAGMFAHYENLNTPTFNLTEAVTHWNLAMGAGLDAVLANNTYELNFFYNDGNRDREYVCLQIKRAFEDIIDDPTSTNPSSPLTINVIGLEWEYYPYMVEGNPLQPIFFYGRAPGYADPHNFVAPIIRSTSTFPERAGLENSIGAGGVPWDTATVDGWIDAAAAESDPATRIALYKNVQEAIVEHMAILWCYQGVEFHVEGKWMNGYVFNPMRDSYFYHIYKKYTGPTDGQLNIPVEILIASAVVMAIIVIVILKKSSRD